MIRHASSPDIHKDDEKLAANAAKAAETNSQVVQKPIMPDADIKNTQQSEKDGMKILDAPVSEKKPQGILKEKSSGSAQGEDVP